MKTFSRLPIVLWICLNASLLYGQTTACSGNAAALPPPTPYAIVQQDANSQVWERTEYELGPSGEAVPRIHSYTELASGLNFLRDGQYLPSLEQIDLLPDGTAAATNGQYQAYFPGDIAQGVIELDTVDGLKLQSRPIALSFDDGSNTVIFAVLTNSPGYLVGSNQVTYPSAFSGANASVSYRYTKSGFEQDILILSQLPPPESFGLNPANTRLQVLTEFFSPPSPMVEPNTLPAQGGMTLTDQNLSFGGTHVVPGRAFLTGSDSQASGVFVAKSWLTLDGRQFLVEEAPVDALAAELAQLPPAPVASAGSRNPSKHPMASRKLRLPAQLFTKVEGGPRLTRGSRLSETKPELVLDYVTLSGTVTNQVFQSDTTYYISGNLGLAGTSNVFEGATVIKFASGGPAITVLSSADVNWQATPYRPVVFTAVDDNSAGQSFGSGTPSGHYAGVALDFAGSNVPVLSNFRVLYALTGFLTSSGSAAPTLRDGQFVNCQYAAQFSGSAAYLRNILFANIQTNFVNLAAPVVDLQNVTFNHVTSLASVASGSPNFYLTNCILAGVTNSGVSLTSFTGDYNGFYNAPEFGSDTLTNAVSPFQTVVGGNYYLATNSPCRNAGTTNIDSTLLADLATKTTYPPIVYANTNFPIATTFSPQAQRDAGDAPDLGYHYDPLDWVFAEDEVDTNVTFTAGTAAAWYRTSSGWYEAGDGLHLMNGASANLIGTATAPVWWVRLNTVQELDTSGGYGPGGLTSWGSGPSTYVATINAQFTHCSMLTVEANHFRDDGCCGGGFLVVNATDCEFYTGGVGAYNPRLCLTNCLFECTIVSDQGTFSTAGVFMQNCTMKGNQLYVSHWSGTTWPVNIENCAFDGVNLSQIDNPSGTTNNYNAFLLGATQLPSEGPNTVIVTNSYNWQTNWLGNYYQSTNSPLIDMGSTSAANVGLYHFTTQTNQTIEGTSIVDIGYHYVAVDTNGIPLDSNGDGIPDYLEDANGNGLVDSGEIGWNIVGDLGLKVFITQPRNGSTLP